MEISWQRKILSYLLSLLFVVRKKCENIPAAKKILIVHWAFLGDIITSVPAIRSLRMAFPNAKIVLLATPETKHYINNLPWVDEIIYQPYPMKSKLTDLFKYKIFRCIRSLRNQKFDLAIELTGRLPNQILLLLTKAQFNVGEDRTNNSYFLDRRITNKRMHEIDRNIEVVKLATGMKCTPTDLWNPATSEDHEFVQSFLKRREIYLPFVIVHIVASWGPKQWSIEKWKKVIAYIISQKKAVILIGTAGEKEKIDQICESTNVMNCFNAAGCFNLSQMLALMTRGEGFIGTDSGPMHFAAIAKLKGVAIFGPGDPVKWGYPLHRVVFKQCSCSPCAQIPLANKCQKGFNECLALQQLEPVDVIQEIQALFNTCGKN
jgi:ADP-heptose:LPS heptosyltransferase